MVKNPGGILTTALKVFQELEMVQIFFFYYEADGIFFHLDG